MKENLPQGDGEGRKKKAPFKGLGERGFMKSKLVFFTTLFNQGRQKICGPVQVSHFVI